jgi:ribonuclease Z
MHLFGPPDFFRQVEGKLAGYAWNLLDEYECTFRFKVSAVYPDKILTREYLTRDCFKVKENEGEQPFSGTLLLEPSFRIKAVILDHRIPCLGLCLEEKFHVNIVKEGLRELGLPVGPWLNRFKKAIYEKGDMDSRFFVTLEERGRIVWQKAYVLGDLARKIARISPGEKIAYITDIIGSAENLEKAMTIARGADQIFIEAAFLECDRNAAKKRYHLTAREAGELARIAGAKQFTPFHFSPRYSHRVEDVKREAMEAFEGKRRP